MKGKVIIAGDIGKIDKLYDQGKITMRERDKMFSDARLHGANGDIFPFAVGGSDIGKLMGLSKYSTPEYTIRNKLDPKKYPEPRSKQTQDSLDDGHIFEASIAQKCALILSRERNKSVGYEPCSLQFKNALWPNIVANIDGFFVVDGKRYLIEVKTAAVGSDAWNLFRDKKIPEDYKLQAATYATILGMDGTIFCVWNKASTDEKDFRVIWFPTPSGHDKILDKVQKIVEDAGKGIIPDDLKIAIPPNLRAKSYEKQYSRLDPTTKPLKVTDELRNVFSKLEELDAERKAKDSEQKTIERPFKDVKNKAERDKNAATRDISKEIKEIEDQITAICAANILPVVQNGESCYIEDGDDIIEVFVDRKLSFNEDAKLWMRTNYPEVWEELNAFKPTYSYRIERQAKA